MRTAKTLISLGGCWAHMPFCLFCHEAAPLVISTQMFLGESVDTWFYSQAVFNTG